VVDIQGLMALGRKAPKPQLMAVYYARLTRIFTVSGSHLYNGYAWCVWCHPRPRFAHACVVVQLIPNLRLRPAWDQARLKLYDRVVLAPLGDPAGSTLRMCV